MHSDHIQRLHDLSLCLNNQDNLGWEAEADNLTHGRPAYWYVGRTSAAMWVVWMARTEDHNHSFLRALEAFVARKPTVDVLEVLDGVIPLNAEAVHELGLCYRLQSTFREDVELADRERRALFDPEFFDGMSDEMRARWERQYEAIQQRWANRREAEYEARKGIGKTAALVIALANIDDAARAAVEGVTLDEVA